MVYLANRAACSRFIGVLCPPDPRFAEAGAPGVARPATKIHLVHPWLIQVFLRYTLPTAAWSTSLTMGSSMFTCGGRLAIQSQQPPAKPGLVMVNRSKGLILMPLKAAFAPEQPN